MYIKQSLSELFPPKPAFTEADLPSLAGKTYLITRGAGGVGKELSRMLYSANATVYMAGRNLASIEKATQDIVENPSPEIKEKPTSGKIVPLVLDLNDLSTIKPAVQELEKTATTLNAVVLNASVMSPPKNVKTTQGYEMQWGTNVLGHFLLQKLLLPLLLASKNQNGQAHIVWTASDGANMSPSPDGISWDDINGDKTNQSSFGLYSQSKAGNIILASETAKRYGSDSIIAVSLNPGHLKTQMARHMNPMIVAVGNATIGYNASLGALTELAAIFAGIVGLENNGAYLIPWGRLGKMAKHVEKGLENGSGEKLWKMLEEETKKFV